MMLTKNLLLLLACVATATALRGNGARSGKSSKETELPNPNSDPSSIEDGPFLDYAFEKISDITAHICTSERDDMDDICYQMNDLAKLGKERYKDDLPRWYYANYSGMTIAYPLVTWLHLVNRWADEDMIELFLEVMAVHMSLGQGNSFRLQGFDEEAVDQAYWAHFKLLKIQVSNIQELPALAQDQHCRYITDEYKQLQRLAEDFGLIIDSVTWGHMDAPAESTAMYLSCIGGGSTVASLISRLDWGHHHMEVVASLLNEAESKRIISYTLWHWESLFSVLFAPDDVVPQLLKSFDSLLPERQGSLESVAMSKERRDEV